MFVLDGHTADLIVVVARAAGTSGKDGISFFTVAGDAAGLTRTPLATMDQTRKQAQARASTGSRRSSSVTAGGGWAGAVQDPRPGRGRRSPTRWWAARSSCSTMSVQYAKDRVQFGRPDRLVPGDQAQVRGHAARGRVGEVGGLLRGLGGARRTTTSCRWSRALAKAYCSDAYFHAAAENIQIHGGIGFTWEHDAHLYFKRAKSSEIFLGDATYHRELLAQRIGI